MKPTNGLLLAHALTQPGAVPPWDDDQVWWKLMDHLYDGFNR